MVWGNLTSGAAPKQRQNLEPGLQPQIFGSWDLGSLRPSSGWAEYPKFGSGPSASPGAEKASEGSEMTVVYLEKEKPEHLQALSLSTSLYTDM